MVVIHAPFSRKHSNSPFWLIAELSSEIQPLSEKARETRPELHSVHVTEQYTPCLEVGDILPVEAHIVVFGAFTLCQTTSTTRPSGSSVTICLSVTTMSTVAVTNISGIISVIQT